MNHIPLTGSIAFLVTKKKKKKEKSGKKIDSFYRPLFSFSFFPSISSAQCNVIYIWPVVLNTVRSITVPIVILSLVYH